MSDILCIVLGSIIGGISGGVVMNMIFSKAVEIKRREFPIGVRLLGYLIGGFLLGIPGGMIAEGLIMIFEK